MWLASHPLRRHILLNLAKEALSVNRLAEQLETTVPAILYHLTVLANYQVVEAVDRNEPRAETRTRSLQAGQQSEELLNLARELESI